MSVGYLIDGFPRELEQGELFKQQVGIQLGVVVAWAVASAYHPRLGQWCIILCTISYSQY